MLKCDGTATDTAAFVFAGTVTFPTLQSSHGYRTNELHVIIGPRHRTCVAYLQLPISRVVWFWVFLSVIDWNILKWPKKI